MLFNSWAFLIFFPVVTTLFYVLPQRWRWLMLLLASCIFYISFIPVYLLILAATIVIDYYAALYIENSQGRRRAIFLWGSVAATCLILFFFKYYDFFALNTTALARLLGWNYSLAALEIILPIGLSFHTFQSLSYVIEVYRGNQKAEQHFGIYALYVMFYPQLVAGPIERPQNLLHQFREKHGFDYRNVVDGLKLAAWGLFKKVVIADRLARFVNPVFDHPTEYQGLVLIVATVFFTFQIFCDFSGYSDIAVGVARVMGFRLMNNFDRPYSAKSLAEFWKRWHISLSTWLRDYIYEPLSLKWRNAGMAGILAALMVTFLISGFWHGANWTYVIWGGLHGLVLCLELMLAKPRKRLSRMMSETVYNALSLLVTFTFLNLSYVFFRARTIDDAWYIISHLGSGDFGFGRLINTSVQSIYSSVPGFWHSKTGEFYFCWGLICLLTGVHTLQSRIHIREYLSGLPWWLRAMIYQICLLALLILGIWLEKLQFIYFQF